MTLRRVFFAALLAGTFAFAADQALLNLVPRDAKMIAGVDAERARNSALGQRVIAGMKDNSDFQNFVAATGFDPRRDLREVIVASEAAQPGGNAIVVARGVFDASRIARFAQEKGAVSSIYQGVEIWRGEGHHGDGAVAFLDSSIAVAGPEGAVRAALDRRTAGTAFKGALAARVAEWSAKNDAWFVSSSIPVPAADGQRAGFNLESVKEASGGVRFGPVVEVTAEAIARSDKDAASLADVVRGLAAMVRMNQDKTGDDLLKLLDGMQVTTDGPSLRVSIQLPQELLEKMLDQPKRVRPSRVAERR